MKRNQLIFFPQDRIIDSGYSGLGGSCFASFKLKVASIKKMPADVYSVPFDSLQYCVELQDSIESAELHHHTTICFQRYLNIESDELITNHEHRKRRTNHEPCFQMCGHFRIYRVCSCQACSSLLKRLLYTAVYVTRPQKRNGSCLHGQTNDLMWDHINEFFQSASLNAAERGDGSAEMRNITLVDGGGQCHIKRSFGAGRIEGDIPPHYGL